MDTQMYCSHCEEPTGPIPLIDGELIHESCEQDRNEAAWEAQQSKFYGGSTPYTLDEQCRAAKGQP